MTIFESIALILSVTAVIGLVNKHWIKLPETIGVMVIALALSLVFIVLSNYLPAPLAFVFDHIANFDFSHFVLHIALPFLLFAGAFSADKEALVCERFQILILSTIGMLISTAAVGFMTYWMLGLIGVSGISLIHCLLFGALISPTDPIAVLAILKKAGVSKSLTTGITGESLVNDGVAVVVFMTLLEIAGANAAEASVVGVGKLLLLEVGGGIAFGSVLGWLGSRALRSAPRCEIDLLLSLAIVTGGYVCAEKLHISAPLAMVVAGLWLGAAVRSKHFDKAERDHLATFWESLDSIFNAVLFVLLGMVVVGHADQILSSHVYAGLIAISFVLLARILSLGFVVPFTALKRNQPGKTIAVMTWGGLRGAISVALAMSLSAETHRDLFVTMTYVIVIFSVIGQGLSIGFVAQKLGLDSNAGEEA